MRRGDWMNPLEYVDTPKLVGLATAEGRGDTGSAYVHLETVWKGTPITSRRSSVVRVLS